MSKSLSGHSLIGSNLTRFVYLDETGTNIKKDPFTVVGGIIVHADKQIELLENGLAKICMDLVPEELWKKGGIKPFHFHASDYMNGNGPYKPLRKIGEWDVHKGMAIADAILTLCESVGVKIVWAGVKNKPEFSKEDLHVHAFARVAIAVDHYMLSEAHTEVCIIVAEDHKEHKKKLKQVVIGLKYKSAIESAGLQGSVVPIRTIKDVVHFVGKNDSSSIQIADTICYIIKKWLDKNQHYDKVFERLQSIGVR